MGNDPVSKLEPMFEILFGLLSAFIGITVVLLFINFLKWFIRVW